MIRARNLIVRLRTAAVNGVRGLPRQPPTKHPVAALLQSSPELDLSPRPSASSHRTGSNADRPELSSLRRSDARSRTARSGPTAASLSTPAEQACRMNPASLSPESTPCSSMHAQSAPRIRKHRLSDPASTPCSRSQRLCSRLAAPSSNVPPLVNWTRPSVCVP